LHPVPGAPSFFYPVYAVCSAQADDELVTLALQGLRDIAAGRQAGEGSVKRAPIGTAG